MDRLPVHNKAQLMPHDDEQSRNQAPKFIYAANLSLKTEKSRLRWHERIYRCEKINRFTVVLGGIIVQKIRTRLMNYRGATRNFKF